MEKTITVIIANFAPYKLITKDGEQPFSLSLDQINNWDSEYTKVLGKIIGKIDIGIKPYDLLITGDGTLILPSVEKYDSINKVLPIFNEFLVCVFLGGEYCKAIGAHDVSHSLVHKENLELILTSIPRGHISKYHTMARSPWFSETERIVFLEPKSIYLSDLKERYEKGKEILNKLNMNLEQILFGATFYTERNFSESLIHFWTVFERMLEKVWMEYVVNQEEGQRKEFLKDGRTWTAATKLEVLYQKGIIDKNFRISIDEARKARNKLAHEGVEPKIELLESLIKNVFQFLSDILSDFKNKDSFQYLVDLIINPDFFDSVEANKHNFSAQKWLDWMNQNGEI